MSSLDRSLSKRSLVIFNLSCSPIVMESWIDLSSSLSIPIFWAFFSSSFVYLQSPKYHSGNTYSCCSLSRCCSFRILGLSSWEWLGAIGGRLLVHLCTQPMWMAIELERSSMVSGFVRTSLEPLGFLLSLLFHVCLIILFLVGLYNFWTCNYACCIVMPFLKYYFLLFPLLGTS